MQEAVLGVDVGTGSTKGVLVDLDGVVLSSTIREHRVSRPRESQFEMDPRVWDDEFTSIATELLASTPTQVVAVGVSGMGPCLALTDSADRPVRDAILYGIDMRASSEISSLTRLLGQNEIVDRCGSALSTQAVGPKVSWVATHEPDVFRSSSRFYMPASWLVRMLTGEYVLDHHSASQCTPLYDARKLDWYDPWWRAICGHLEKPRLLWSGEVAGQVTADASSRTGIPAGTPVIAGSIDAWTEAVSVGATQPGDLMLMYGSTMFLINTVDHRVSSDVLWGTVGIEPGQRCLAAGMATSGLVTDWVKSITQTKTFHELVQAAEATPPGANGLLLLPYFAGERTPIADPRARGVLNGLTLKHGLGDVYRAALEGIAFGVRHNIDEIRRWGGDVRRVTAVGGGTQARLWLSIVSDVTGLPQILRAQSIGASYGSAFLAAGLVTSVELDKWNPVKEVVHPDAGLTDFYSSRFPAYRSLYDVSADLMHLLADGPSASRTHDR